MHLFLLFLSFNVAYSSRNDARETSQLHLPIRTYITRPTDALSFHEAINPRFTTTYDSTRFSPSIFPSSDDFLEIYWPVRPIQTSHEDALRRFRLNGKVDRMHFSSRNSRVDGGNCTGSVSRCLGRL